MVNNTIENASESVTTYGYHHFFSETDPARITGSTGRTHGARIVRIPAMNEINMSVKVDRVNSYIEKVKPQFLLQKGLIYRVNTLLLSMFSTSSQYQHRTSSRGTEILGMENNS